MKNKVSKVYMSNFPLISKKFDLTNDSTKYKESALAGFDTKVDNKKIVNDFIQNLLIYEKIAISIFDITYLVNIFEMNRVLFLLQNNILEIIDDNGLITSLVMNNKDNYKFYQLFSKNSLERIEKSAISSDKEALNKFFLQVEKNITYKDIVLPLSKILEGEIKYDLKNQNYTSNLQLISNEINKIDYRDIGKILRMGYINQSLAISEKIQADNIHLDGWAKEFMNYKLSPVLQDKSFINVNETFTDLINKKSIPNLGELYLKGVVTLEDILEVRNNIDGKTFRYWFNSIDYNFEEAWREILNKKNTFSSNILKTMRFTIPNIVGLVNTPLGIAMGAVDSFIVNKILEGWSPQLFLDNQLKKKIDEKIEFNQNLMRKNRVLEKFPNT